ncbi:hypothetical protein BLA29_000764 [Euroglyphus maynei]|uniref:Uncharacterized protein n=1 Tax=Euroglyphus maynei TaxID=6958 RepID=A0A1Y3BH69_EURMA|nr:hypothetical protein BLA29_000764 [Euroglyphus maynei]
MSSLRYLMNVEGISGRFNNLLYVPCTNRTNVGCIWPIVSPQSKFKLTDLYLLDGGHNGSKDFWIVQPEFIDSLVKHGCRRFHLGVTDFQLNKPQKIRQEFETFYNILRSMSNVQVEKTYLAQNNFPNLSPINLHFKLLDYLFENLL